MTFYPNQRIGIFIDGSNLHSTIKTLAYDIDYKKLLTLFQDRGILVRAYYYTAVLEHDDYSPVRPLIDWLGYNGYHVVTKPAKSFTDNNGRRRIKGNMDGEMIVDMMDMSDTFDHIVLFSGDADFRRVVEVLQRRGLRVSVASTLKSNPPMLADELRRQADNVIELDDLGKSIGRTSTPKEHIFDYTQETPSENSHEDDKN